MPDSPIRTYWEGVVDNKIENVMVLLRVSQDNDKELRDLILAKDQKHDAAMQDMRLWRARITGQASVVGVIAGLLGAAIVELALRVWR